MTSIEVMGLGTRPDQVAAFVASGSLLGDVGRLYIASWVGELIPAGAAVSAFACCAAVPVGASRLLFAVSRDSPDNRALAFTAGISRRHGTPSGALIVITALAAMTAVAWAVIYCGASAIDIVGGSATITALLALVAYLALTVGALRFLFLSGRRRVPAWEIVIPIASIAVLGYVLFRNVWPIPATDHQCSGSRARPRPGS